MLPRFAISLFILSIYFPFNTAFGDFLYIANEGEGGADISVLDATTFAPVTGSPIAASGVDNIGISPDGTLVYVPNSSTVIVFNGDPPVATIAGSPFATGGTGFSFGLAVGPNGTPSANKIFITNDISADISVLDAMTLAPIGASPYSNVGIFPDFLAINPTGTSLYVTDRTNSTVVKLNATTLLPENGPTSTVATPVTIAISPDGSLVYVGTAAQDTLVFNATNLALIGTHPAGTGDLAQIVLSPDGSRLYVTDEDTLSNNVFGFNTNDFSAIAGSPINSGGIAPKGITINSTGTRLYVTNRTSVNVSEINTNDFTLIGTHPSGSSNDPVFITITPHQPTPPPPPPPPPPPSSVTPPNNLSGKQKKNDFGYEFELFNLLEWSPSNTAGVNGYNVYRNGTKIATLNAATLKYQDHNRPKGVSTLYSVTAFIGSSESAPINVQIN